MNADGAFSSPSTMSSRILDPAGLYQRRDFFQERGTAVDMVADDEPADHRAADEQRPPVRAARILRRVVFGDQPAQWNPRAAIEVLHHRRQHCPADVLEIDVDPVGTGRAQRCLEIVGLVVDTRVKTELVDHVAALVRRTGDSNRSTPYDLGQLTDHRSDCARCSRYDDGLAGFRLTDVHQADERGHPGHAEDAKRRGNRNARDRGCEVPFLPTHRTVATRRSRERCRLC